MITPSTPRGHNSPERKRSVISEDLFVDGGIATTGILELHGKVTGTVEADALVLSNGAEVKGAIRARSATIAGRSAGSIAADTLVLETRAIVASDIEYGSLTVQTGADVQGSFKRRAG